MKKPRVEDFDPLAVPPLGSPLDDMPAIQPPARSSVPLDQPAPPTDSPSTVENRPVTITRYGEKTEAQESNRTNVRLPVRRRVRRTITRYAFEFYQDQIDKLRSLALDEKLAGDRGSMSQMVREAIDEYLANRKRTEE